MELFQDLRENLYLKEATFLSYFQEKLADYEDLLVPVSSIGDPSKGFTVYFPLILALNYLKGIKFLGAFIISEWINMVGKWLLQGDRPYWWVREQGYNISLVQTRLSCETGPGVPSGHSQAAGVIVFCLVDCSLSTFSWCRARWCRPGLWLLFLASQLMMWTSRTYISAHFPHQCLLGFIVSLLVVRKFYSRGSWIQCKTFPLILFSLFLVGSSLAVYVLLLRLGINPDWSISLAKKHCNSSDWIHIDTTPFYAMMRFSGAALGLSMSGFLTMDVFSSPSVLTKLTTLVTGLGLGQLAHLVHNNIPREPLHQFYLLEFLLNAFYIFVVVKTFQLLLSSNFCGNQKTKKKYQY